MINTDKWHVRVLSEAEFQTMEHDWQTCLRNSDANSLFMSWPWLFSWWETWAQVLGLDLMLIAVFNRNQKIVGIGPFYIRDLITPIGIRVRRVHFIGNAFRLEPTVRTEYCSLIVDRSDESTIRQLILSRLVANNWDELVVCDAIPSEVESITETFETLGAPCSLVKRTSDTGVRLKTEELFVDWISKLGRNTRLKVYNRRKYLENKYDLVYMNKSTKSPREFFENLNEFNHQRWKKPAFDDKALRFHERIIKRSGNFNIKYDLSELSIDGNCQSMIYDLTSEGRRYNIQSGYNQSFDPKVSLGLMHLGYAIEDSFSSLRTKYYDLLAGGGKNQYFKTHLKGQNQEFNTVHWVRNSFVSMAYKYQGMAPAPLRKIASKSLKL